MTAILKQDEKGRASQADHNSGVLVYRLQNDVGVGVVLNHLTTILKTEHFFCDNFFLFFQLSRSSWHAHRPVCSFSAFQLY